MPDLNYPQFAAVPEPEPETSDVSGDQWGPGCQGGLLLIPRSSPPKEAVHTFGQNQENEWIEKKM